MPFFPVRFEHFPPTAALGFFLALSAIVIYLGVHSLSGLTPFRKWASIALRIDLLLFLVLLLSGAKWEKPAKDLSLVVLRDTSASVSRESDATRIYRGFEASLWREKPATDRLGVIQFDATARISHMPMVSRVSDGAIASASPMETNPADAIRLALATLPADTRARMLLMWDGNATSEPGQLSEVVASAVAQGVPIDVMPLRYAVERDVAVERLVAPTHWSENAPASISVLIRSRNTETVTAALSVSDLGKPIDMNPDTPEPDVSARVELKPGMNILRLPVGPLAAGVHEFRATVVVLDETPAGTTSPSDAIASNNFASAMTLVRGTPRVLFVSTGDVGQHSPLLETLRTTGFSIETTDASSFPTQRAGLQPYDAVILADTPLGLGGLSNLADAALVDYVHNLGGGLLIIGGPHSYGAGGWIGSELERILPVELSPPARRVVPSGALVLAIDHSGSMTGDLANSPASKQRLANEAAILAVKTLSPRDRVGVLAFNTHPTWVVPLDLNSSVSKTILHIQNIPSGGGTDILPALRASAGSLLDLPPDAASVKHILLVTDGRAPPADQPELFAKLAEGKITLSVVGIGDDVDHEHLATLARLGKGTYYPVHNPTLLPQVFIREAQIIKRTLIEERPFIPSLRDESTLTAGLASLPQLTGMVITARKNHPQVELSASNDKGDPLLARWRTGLGQVTVFTSDAQTRWSGRFVGSPDYDRFWVQLLRSTARPAMSNQLEPRIVPVSPHQARLVVQATADDGSFASALTLNATITPPVSSSAPSSLRSTPPLKLTLTQTSPGQYEAVFPTALSDPSGGAYLAHIASSANASEWTAVAYSPPASPELSALKTDEAALAEVATRTGGRVLTPYETDPALLFSRDNTRPRSAPIPLNGLLLASAVATLVLDVAVRRVEVDPRKALGWVTSHTQAPANVIATDSLKSVKTIATATLSGSATLPGKGQAVGAGQVAAGITSPVYSIPSPARIDASDPTASTPPAPSFLSPLDPSAHPSASATPAESQDLLSPMERLAAAKKRAANRPD